MNTKLTLTLEKEIIEEAKKYASAKGKSLSEMVENYFRYITEFKPDNKKIKLSSKSEALRGIVKVDADFDYKKNLDEEKSKKYGL